MQIVPIKIQLQQPTDHEIACFTPNATNSIQSSIMSLASPNITERANAFFSLHGIPIGPKVWGHGSDSVVASGLAHHELGDDSKENLDLARQYQSALFDAGLAWLSGPIEFGGSDFSRSEVIEFRSIASKFTTIDASVFMIGQQIIAPAILAFGSVNQKKQYLMDLYRGSLIGCQLFSEPDAGSDLASLRCRAQKVEGGWQITGQKVWSSGAHWSDFGELLARTDEDLTLRHRGLTMFLINMKAAEVTVRPLRQMNGNSHFNHVFIDNLFVGDSEVLGPIGNGWDVANASLKSERDLNPADAGLFLDISNRLLELSQSLGSQNSIMRQELAEVITRERIAVWMRDSLKFSGTNVSGVSSSIMKLYEARSVWKIAQLAAQILGPRITADSGAWGTYAWSDLLLGAHSQRIAGGTDEIQLNIIGERGLGLPREPR